MPRVIRPPKYAFSPTKSEPQSAPAPDPVTALGNIIEQLLAENPNYKFADVRALLMCAGFKKKVIGEVWRDRFHKMHAHLEPSRPEVRA